MTSSSEVAASTDNSSFDDMKAKHAKTTPTPTTTPPSSPLPTSAETPQFCKRISVEEVNAESKFKTHTELLNIGALMRDKENPCLPINKDIFNIKTMSLTELYEYVENKLSRDHYSPEVIYLLFKIQSLLLEKEQLTKMIRNNEITIADQKKELLEEKVLVCDLKESIRDTTGELDTMDKETTVEINRLNTDIIKLCETSKNLVTRKKFYEKILYYLVPFTIVVCAIVVNHVVYMINRFIFSI